MEGVITNMNLDIRVRIHQDFLPAKFIQEGQMGILLEEEVKIGDVFVMFIPAEWFDFSWFRAAIPNFKIIWGKTIGNQKTEEVKDVKPRTKVYTV
jgi:hypothetical protein